jgi:peptidoglycan biosynthesis protein MviN/MurJ (putative lipid II flippase)
LFVICFKDVLEVRSLAAGVLGASLLQFCTVNVIMKVQLKCKVRPGACRMDKQTLRNLLYILAANISTFLYGFVCMYLLSGFEEGVYSAMSYSEKLYASINTIFTCQISTVIGISVIDLYIAGDYTRLNNIFMKYLKVGFFIITPICFILSLNSDTVISILFGRGEFTQKSVYLTAGFFMYFVLAIPMRLIYSLLERLMIAKQIQKSVFYWQVFESTLGIIITGAFIAKFGYKGYASGSLLSLLIYISIFTHFILKREFAFIDRSGMIAFLIENTALNMVISLFILIGLKSLHVSDQLDFKILSVIFSTISYILLYLILGYFGKSNREVMGELLESVKGLVKNE